MAVKAGARVVIDRDVEELPTGAAGLVTRVAGDAMAGPDDAGEPLDADMEQIARSGVFVTDGRRLGFDHVLLVSA